MPITPLEGVEGCQDSRVSGTTPPLPPGPQRPDWPLAPCLRTPAQCLIGNQGLPGALSTSGRLLQVLRAGHSEQASGGFGHEQLGALGAVTRYLAARAQGGSTQRVALGAAIGPTSGLEAEPLESYRAWAMVIGREPPSSLMFKCVTAAAAPVLCIGKTPASKAPA